MHNVTGLDSKEYKWNFQKYYPRKARQGKSKYHSQARDLLKELFPNDTLYEEVTLPGSSTLGRKSLLYLDFYIPSLEIAVEVHGQQHYEYIPHFHKTHADFLRGRRRDNDKEEWCQINQITLIILPWDQTQQWERILENRG